MAYSGERTVTTGDLANDRDAGFMRQALALARRAEGRTAPNPMVGCVLVRDGEVIGEGFHEGPGRAHAEVAAIADAARRNRDANGAAAYVTLEPCNHFGRTGPCAEALIAAGVAEVIYALADPNPLAAGGAARLEAAGVRTRRGVCEEEARALARGWLTGIAEQRPFMTAKTAMSLDGRIAARTGESQWITGPKARDAGHRLRWASDAIIVGAGTVLADDPTLTARPAAATLDDGRVYAGERRPLRVVLDSNGRTPPGAKAFERPSTDDDAGAMLATTDRISARRAARYSDLGVDVCVLPTDENGKVDLSALLAALFARDVRNTMIEGGGEALGAFFDADLIDEINIFVAPKLIGGGKPAFGGAGVGALADAARFAFDEPTAVGDDLWWRGLRRRTAEGAA